MTYCAECGAEVTERRQVCQKCSNLVFTKEIITRKIIELKERMILLLSILIILLGIFTLIYINTSIPSKYRVPELYSFVVFIVLLGLFFITKRKWMLEWNKENILNTFFSPIPGLPLSEKNVHCVSCGTKNLSSRQICKKCEEILLTEEILFKRITYNSKKSFFVLGIVSLICGTFFATLYSQYNLNLNFFWLLGCFYLIVSGLLLILMPKRLSDWGTKRFLSKIKKDYVNN